MTNDAQPAEPPPPDAAAPPPEAPAVEALPLDQFRGPFDRWLLDNLGPLLLSSLCLILMLLLAPGMNEVARHAPKPAQVPAAPVPELTAESVANLTWFQIVWLGAAFLGAVAAIMAAVASLRRPAARQWLRDLLKRLAVRPLPALRLMDLVAIVMLWFAAGAAVTVLVDSLHVKNKELALAADALGDTLAKVLVIWGIVALARQRARAPQGSAGLWPFWTLSRLAPRRTYWQDIRLGLLAYPLCAWMVMLAAVLNDWAVKWLGAAPDTHPLLPMLKNHHNFWVLAAIFFIATAGAGILEELIFRGMLYNVLRRYLGRAVAAAGAALISAMHGLLSSLLPLFVLALLLIWLYDKTGRLVAGMTFHALNNAITLLLFMTAK